MMTANEFVNKAAIHSRVKHPWRCRLLGRHRLHGTAEIVFLTCRLEEANQHLTERDVPRLRDAIKAKVAEEYGSVWLMLVVEIIIALIQYWLEHRNE